MSDFTLNTNFNFDDETLARISENAYLDVANLVYTGMYFNSDLDDLLFLNSYFTQTFTKYYSILEYLGAFNDKIEVQRFVDITISIISATMEYFYKTDISEALRFFINQFLKIVYDNTEFSVINIKLNSNVQQHTYKIIIEPISINKEELCELDNVDQFCELIIMLLSYAESINRCVSIGVLKSNLWINKYNSDFPEIADDNMFPELFNTYPAIYKTLFKSRYMMLKELGIDTADLSEEITLNEEAETMYNNIIEASKNKEYLDIDDIGKELIEYSKIISDLYYKNIYKNKQLITNIRIEDLNTDYTIDVPVYIELLTALDDNKFNIWTIQQLVKYYYDDITGEDGYLKEPLSDEEKLKLNDLLNALKDIDDLNINNNSDEIENIEKNEKNINKNLSDKIIENKENKVKFKLPDFNDLRISETNPSEKKEDGYQTFIPDYHAVNEIKLIYDLKDYIESTLNIYINNKGKINASLIKKIVKSYNNDTIEIINISDSKNRCIAEVKDSLENIFRFTISKKDGKIECIENKEK